MNKKILSLLFALLLLLSAALPVYADEAEEADVRRVTISNLKNFQKLVENCRLDSYSRNLVVSLQTDLDLEGKEFDGIPIFSGTFEGNGHVIRGLNITAKGSDQGFFRYLTESAVVQDLHLQGMIQPDGSASEVGGFAGKNSGSLLNCSFNGTVSGKEFVGGITGSNTVTGIIENCHVSGSVYGAHFVGGFAGKNAGVIRSCENKALINETPQQNTVELTDVTINSLVRTEASNTVTDIGGIAGNNTGLIRDCVNDASVGYLRMGYNIGGIAGTQSGTILNCENHGGIFGRKEVGGIAGQMEPSSVMDFEEDVLQVLGRQLDGMVRIVNDASSNLQGAGESIINQMGTMRYYVWDAQDAVETLIPDWHAPSLPDLDTIVAARNNIGSSLIGMSQVMGNIGATAYSALGAVSTNLYAINDQINAMRTTLGNVSEKLGGSIIDMSDVDSDLYYNGKVADCRNLGEVHADLNGGGITGAIAMENDLDMEEDWFISGENSLNFESELRAAILNCENTAQISVGKQNAGGIAGFQSLGLVKNSRNFGKVDAANANYAGGISGRSLGYIRGSHANAEIQGNNYVGGIAGSAAIVTDCYSLVKLSGGAEKIGAVLGYTEENQSEEEAPISGNYYLAVQEDPGAIDGISYDLQAQPMKEEEFFLLEGLPERFRQVIVTFRYGNGTVRNFTVDFGSAFPEQWIPAVPPKDGRQSYWKGLEETDLSGICFDMIFEQAYTNQMTVLESPLTRGDIPLLLVQGVFSEEAAVIVEASGEKPVLQSGEKLLEVWQFQTSEPENQTQIRLQLPEKTDAETMRILIRDANASWRAEEHHVFGRYAVVPLTSGDNAIALVQTSTIPWLLVGALLAGILALAGLFYIRKKKTNS